MAGIIGLTILLLAGCAGAKTLTVDDSGGADFTRIQEAINYAVAGDTILVYSGTYQEKVVVTKPLILKGIDNGGGKPVVKAATRERPDEIPIALSSGSVTIDGFRTESGIAGIYVITKNNIIINNAALDNEVGIYLNGSSNNILKNNTANNNKYGILLRDSSNNNILNGNTASNNDYGIYQVFSGNNTLSGNNVSRNIVWGIYFARISNNTIYNNFFNNNVNFMSRSNLDNEWNISKTQGINIVGGPNLGGNFWANPMGTGFSQTCPDDDNDGICDSPYIVEQVPNKNIDFSPLAYMPTASKMTLKVDDRGGADYKKIQDAINNAKAGATILVYSGTYNENVIVNKPLILKGIDNGWGKPIIKSSGWDEWGNSHNAITLRAGNSIIDGFKTIDGNSGIYINSSNNIIINNTLLNGGGIRLVGSSNNIIKNNIAINNYYDIGMDFSDNNTIYNNFLSSNNNLGGLAKSLNKWNITRIANINIIGGSYLGGNVWTNPSGTGFSQTCEDNNNDGICDSPHICDSPYYLGAGNLDQLPLVYKPLTIRLINLALIFLTLGTIVMLYLKRDIWDEIRSTALTAIKGAIKNLIIGVIMGVLAGFVVGGVIATILLHLGFFAKADDPAWIYGVSMILGAFLGVIVGAIAGLIKDVTIGAIAGAICGIVFEISVANKDLTTIREFIGGAIGVVILGAIAGSLISRAIFNAREIGSMSGAIIGGIIGFGGLFESMSGSFIGSIFTGIIFGCFIGGVLGLLARRLTANKEAIPLGAILGLFGSVIAGSITGIFFHGEALYISLIASMLVGAIIGGTICLYSGSGKYAFIRAFIGGMIAGSLAGLIGGGAFIDGILIINKKIFDESVMFSGIVGAVVGMVIGALQTRKNAILESAVAGSISAEIAGLFGYAAAGGYYPKISLIVIPITGIIVGGLINKYYGTRKNTILFVILGGIIIGIILGVAGAVMRF